MIKPFGFALFRNGTFSGFYASKSAASRFANKLGGEVRPVADQAELDALDASLHEPTVTKPDYIFTDERSLALCTPQSKRAEEHLRAHTNAETQRFAGSIAVEHRYVESLALALQDDGFEVAFE